MHYSIAPLEGTLVCLKKHITVLMFYLLDVCCEMMNVNMWLIS